MKVKISSVHLYPKLSAIFTALLNILTPFVIYYNAVQCCTNCTIYNAQIFIIHKLSGKTQIVLTIEFYIKMRVGSFQE